MPLYKGINGRCDWSMLPVQNQKSGVLGNRKDGKKGLSSSFKGGLKGISTPDRDIGGVPSTCMLFNSKKLGLDKSGVSGLGYTF